MPSWKNNNLDKQSQLTSAIVQHYETSRWPLHVDGATVVVAVVRRTHVVDESHGKQEARRQDGGRYGHIPVDGERRLYVKWLGRWVEVRCLDVEGKLQGRWPDVYTYDDWGKKAMCNVAVDLKRKLYWYIKHL